MNVLSLFSGIGGLDLGLQRAGMTIVGQVEIDPWCRKILAKHWPEVPRHDDVRTAADWWLTLVADAAGSGRAAQKRQRPEPALAGTADSASPCGVLADGETGTATTASRGRPAVDLVCGGFPCQPVSSAGRRLAQDDPRWLWPAMAEVIRRLRPRYALMENVPGLLARGMGDVLGDLAACGYDAEWDCVPASAIGAPHRRDRVWIVAYAQRDPGNARWPSDPSEGARGRDAGRGTPGADVADAGSKRCGEGSWQFDGLGPAGCSPPLAHANGTPRPPSRPSGETVFRPVPVERPGRRGGSYGDHWVVEPAVGRVAHGIPRRVDRLRGLGNAVVPQVAEHIGRLIMAGAA